MKKLLLLLITCFCLGNTQLRAQCARLLETCAKENAGSMTGFTLVDAAYDELNKTGGKLRITLYKGTTYRFLACKASKVPNLVIALADGNGMVLATNLTEDQKSQLKALEVNCTATAEYTVIMLPLNGEGCCGVIYAMRK